MNSKSLLDFLRRELTPTAGRGSATFRLVLACMAATVPILSHHIPEAVLVMMVMYMVAREDTAATLIGSIMSAAGVTIGLASALLAWEISLDIPWLRLCFLIAFIFGSQFLQRVLRIGALGAAIGIPAAMVMIFPDTFPPNPELMVEMVLWIWWCVILGLAINAGVQLLLSPGDPLTLLRRALDTRLLAVEQALRRLAGNAAIEPPPASLNALAIEGMTRPLSLLKSASIFQPWARKHRDQLAAIVTLTDRLVTSAVSIEAIASLSNEMMSRQRLLNVADSCNRTRLAFKELRFPAPTKWPELAAGEMSDMLSPLADMESTLDQIALAVPDGAVRSGESAAASSGKPGLFLPGAFTNPEYLHFAIKSSLAALICYGCFIGFDYPGISTSLLTCLVVSLSTIGASNQKGILRIGGAVVGGLIGMIALIYLFPNVETFSGFLLIFAAGTAVAGWLNFGSPRISYAGNQLGLAFYIAVLHFGPSLNLTSIRDRMIGIAFGLIVFGIVEHLLWPVRAANTLHANVAELMHLLAELARTEASSEVEAFASKDATSWRRQISIKVEEIQRLIESSKFESSTFKVSEIQKHIGDAQIVFTLLIALARQRLDVTKPDVVRMAASKVDNAIATAILALETYVTSGSRPALPNLEGEVDMFERSNAGMDALHTTAADPRLVERLAIYRALVAAINRLSAAMSFDDQWISPHLAVNESPKHNLA
jgi:multidrug resistance protein MdtO